MRLPWRRPPKDGPNPWAYMVSGAYIGYDGCVPEEGDECWIPAIMVSRRESARVGDMMVPEGKMSRILMEINSSEQPPKIWNLSGK